MIEAMRWLGILIMAVLRDRRDLALENLALRQQLEVLKRRKGVPRLQKGERVFWVMLSRIWAAWRQALHLVNGDTVVGWQRKGFRIYWTRISQRKSGGRPQVSSEVRALIKRMATTNPYWGAPRIHGELLKLGIEISERTVSRLIPRGRKPPSQTWKAFLNNHVQGLLSVHCCPNWLRIWLGSSEIVDKIELCSVCSGAGSPFRISVLSYCAV